MKLSEIKGERAVEVIADLIEPIANIASDKECADLFSIKPVAGEDRNITAKKHLLKRVPKLLKNHSHDVAQIIAALSEKELKKMNLLDITVSIVDLAKDKEFIQFFISAAQSVEETPPTDTSEK